MRPQKELSQTRRHRTTHSFEKVVNDAQRGVITVQPSAKTQESISSLSESSETVKPVIDDIDALDNINNSSSKSSSSNTLSSHSEEERSLSRSRIYTAMHSDISHRRTDSADCADTFNANSGMARFKFRFAFSKLEDALRSGISANIGEYREDALWIERDLSVVVCCGAELGLNTVGLGHITGSDGKS